MLKKKERLTRAEFDRFFSVGKRIHTPLLQIIYSPSDTFHGSVVVGKKVYKSAVDRNRLRRQLYAFLRQFYKKNEVLPPHTVIVITKPAIKGLKKDVFITDLKDSLVKITTP